MLIDRNEAITPRDVSAIHGTYKKNSELEDVPTASPGSNSPGIAGGYAATGTFQHPFRWKIANIPQGPLLIDVETDVEKKTFAQDLGVMKNFKEMIESLNPSDNGKKTFAQDLGVMKNFKEMIESLNPSDNGKKTFAENSKLLEKLKEAMESFNSSDHEKNIIMGDSKLLKELKEMIESFNSSDHENNIIMEDSKLLKEIKETVEKVNSSDLPFADIREPKEKFSTPPQFDLSADLQEFLEKQSAMQATDEGSAGNTSNTPPQFDLSAGLQEFLEKQSTMQAMYEGSTGNTNNTSDSGDSADYNLLNIEA